VSCWSGVEGIEGKGLEVDLEGFALRELLEFIRKESPAWPEGAVVDEAPVEVDGKVLVQLLMHRDRVQALGRVLSRTGTRDDQEEEAVNALLRALRRWAESQAVDIPTKAILRLVKSTPARGEDQ
jgi:hypothetical protein